MEMLRYYCHYFMTRVTAYALATTPMLLLILLQVSFPLVFLSTSRSNGLNIIITPFS